MDNRQKTKFPKTAIAAVVVVVMGIATLQMISMLSVHSAVAEPTNNQGRCLKANDFQTHEEAHDLCTKANFKQGECLKQVKEQQTILTKEQCKEAF
jgi:hypothetical protein